MKFYAVGRYIDYRLRRPHSIRPLKKNASNFCALFLLRGRGVGQRRVEALEGNPQLPNDERPLLGIYK